MTKGKWRFLVTTAVIIDAIQLAADLFLTEALFGPEIGSEIADPIIGIALLAYLWRNGVRLTYQRIISLIGVEILEEGTGGGAPTWFLEILYLQWSTKGQEAEEAAQNQDREAALAIGASRQTIYGEKDGEGIRLPDASRNTLASKAVNSLDGIRPPGGGLNPA